MLLLGVVFALLTVGLVVPCVIDIATTPRHHFDLPTKQNWLVVVIGFWVFGAVAWLLLGRREVRIRRLWDDVTGSWVPAHETDRLRPSRMDRGDFLFGQSRRGRQAAIAPARFVAPDDNPEFLLELERRIQMWREEDGI
ncbi:MAG: PLDc N-terminal domain-containing protein [Streptosporangiaceae bacterium]